MAISWTRCSQVLGELTPEERAFLKQFGNGDVLECPEPMRSCFKSLGLIQVINGATQLTEEGRLLAVLA